MNRLYLIVPILLLAIFGGVYWRHANEAAETAKEKAAAIARVKAAEEEKEAVAERLAREDAEKRAAARLLEEEKREAEKRARWEADSTLIATDTARYGAQAAEAGKQALTLEKQLAELRASKRALNEEAFAAAHEVELLRIQKRNAELEIQRMTEMVARKAADALPGASTP